jgi:hypothetical protein
VSALLHIQVHDDAVAQHVAASAGVTVPPQDDFGENIYHVDGPYWGVRSGAPPHISLPLALVYASVQEPLAQ